MHKHLGSFTQTHPKNFQKPKNLGLMHEMYEE